MHRVIAAALVLSALAAPAALAAGPAAAEARVVGTAVCTITDDRAVGLSGLVATPTGYIAVSDSNYDKSKIRIWYFDRSCHPIRSAGYPSPAYDPEDAALGRDGSLYVADIGDNGAERKTITIWRLAPGSSTAKIYRYAYPDGAHDAEALLLTAGDEPIIVTKAPLLASIYEPVGAPAPGGEPVRLHKLGTVAIGPTGTPNGEGVAGSTVVTGGTQTLDRTKVALRTYADAYEWTVSGGDVVGAITGTKPVVTPLAGEPQGESIAYAPDGKTFYTLSDVESAPMRDTIRRYPSAMTTSPAGAPDVSRTAGTPGSAGAPASAADGRTDGAGSGPASATPRPVSSSSRAALMIVLTAALLLALIAIFVVIGRRRRG